MLNNLCIKIKEGDDTAFKLLIADKRIKGIINKAVFVIHSKNKDISIKDLKSWAICIIWLEIKKNYIGATDIKKGDRLVLRFLSTRLFGLLFNEIKKYKDLIGSSELTSKFDKVVLTDNSRDKGNNESSSQLEEEIIPRDYVDIYEVHMQQAEIEKIINRLIITGKISHIENLTFSLIYQGYTSKEVSGIIKIQFNIEKSVRLINLMNKKVLELLSYEYKT